MALKTDISRFDCYDECGTHVFSVERTDESCADVKMNVTVTDESWAEINEEVSKCLQKMELNSSSIVATPE